MDSSIEEDQEEFFESLEAIPPSSSSESESEVEDNRHSNTSQEAMAKASVEAQPVAFSRYEVWKSDSGSIFDRRQRLLTQMGLKLEREGPDNAVVLLDAASSEGRLLGVPLSSIQQLKKVGSGLRNPATYDVGLSNTKDGMKDHKAGLAQARDSGLTTPWSRSDGMYDGHEAKDSSVRMVRSGTTSPELPLQVHERLVDYSGAVLRSGSSVHGLPFSKPPLGGDVCMAASNSVREGIVAQRLNSSNISLDSEGLDGECIDCMPHVLVKDGRLSLESSRDVQNRQEGELLCRIKDLDSGKEFIVNEVGKDGLWNKLKELDTGRELTLEEFESFLGLSPIVQEVMKRERAADDTDVTNMQMDTRSGIEKKRRAWLKVIKGMVRGSQEKGHHKSCNDDKVPSMEKSGRRSGLATNDSQETPSQTAKRIKVHAHKKSTKEFADLYLRQEIQAHQGAIWTMKFSLDGSFLASAGQDRVVRVWEVIEQNEGVKYSTDISGDSCSSVEKLGADDLLPRQNNFKSSVKETTRQTVAISSTSQTNKRFLLSESSKCAFNGHTEDILDLSWSRSQSLLSSSMDKTVRLWNILTRECLRIFTHNDYVTCIHFNPVDDGYFISGSLDGKVRIWSIKERQVVDWADLREMVTAACYTPNGQGAVVGSYKGTCRFYKTAADNKLQFDTTFEAQRKKNKRSQGKKITGFQFIPGDEDKVLITSSDSRIRVYDGTKISSKYKGLRNTKSQISASFSSNGMYIICASEDSRVCIWKYYDTSLGYSVQQQKGLSGSYEDFSARHVSIAIPWPGMGLKFMQSKPNDDSFSVIKKAFSTLETNLDIGGCLPVSMLADGSNLDVVSSCEASSFHPLNGVAVHENIRESVATGLAHGSRVVSHCSELHQHASYLVSRENSSPVLGGVSFTSSMLDCYLEDCCGSSGFSKGLPNQQGGSHGFFSEGRGSATWPEEKLPSVQQAKGPAVPKVQTRTLDAAEDVADRKVTAMTTAWGLIIVTAGLEGEIQIFQNYSLPA